MLSSHHVLIGLEDDVIMVSIMMSHFWLSSDNFGSLNNSYSLRVMLGSHGCRELLG